MSSYNFSSTWCPQRAMLAHDDDDSYSMGHGVGTHKVKKFDFRGGLLVFDHTYACLDGNPKLVILVNIM